MSPRGVLRLLAAGALVLALLAALSPVYRDFFLDHRDRYRGASFAAHLGPTEYDRQVMREFTWGGWFWDPCARWACRASRTWACVPSNRYSSSWFASCRRRPPGTGTT